MADGAGAQIASGHAFTLTPEEPPSLSAAGCTACPVDEPAWCDRVQTGCNRIAEARGQSSNGPITYCDQHSGTSFKFDEERFCRVESTSGLCGIFRVDIYSGGFYWNLFSNCDGTAREEYRIFDNGADACAAYNPNPEMTVQNLSAAGTCPDYIVDFDITNIGCTEASFARYAIVSDCPGSSVLRGDAGGLGANSTVHVSVPYRNSCTDASTLRVIVDPDDSVLECSENAGAAKCNSIPGVESLALSVCSCTATIGPAAAVAPSSCGGQALTLDGSPSSIDGCAGVAEYRWSEDGVGVLRDWSPEPVVELPPYAHAWSPGDGLSDPSDANPMVSPVADTVFVVTMTDALGCHSESAVEVLVSSLMQSDAGTDAVLCEGESITLGGAPTATGGAAPTRAAPPVVPVRLPAPPLFDRGAYVGRLARLAAAAESRRKNRLGRGAWHAAGAPA